MHLFFLNVHFRSYLKEKLPQAFMQIEWMENDFRNLTAKLWANLDNPIKSYDFSKFWLKFLVCRPLRWHCANICNVTTVPLSNGTVHKFHEIFTFHENLIFPLHLYRGMLGLRWLCMHLWLNLINWTTDIQEKIYIVNFYMYMYKVNGELFSCDITNSGIVPSREGDIQNFA